MDDLYMLPTMEPGFLDPSASYMDQHQQNPSLDFGNMALSVTVPNGEFHAGTFAQGAAPSLHPMDLQAPPLFNNALNGQYGDSYMNQQMPQYNSEPYMLQYQQPQQMPQYPHQQQPQFNEPQPNPQLPYQQQQQYSNPQLPYQQQQQQQCQYQTPQFPYNQQMQIGYQQFQMGQGRYQEAQMQTGYQQPQIAQFSDRQSANQQMLDGQNQQQQQRLLRPPATPAPDRLGPNMSFGAIQQAAAVDHPSSTGFTHRVAGGGFGNNLDRYRQRPGGEMESIGASMDVTEPNDGPPAQFQRDTWSPNRSPRLHHALAAYENAALEEPKQANRRLAKLLETGRKYVDSVEELAEVLAKSKEHKMVIPELEVRKRNALVREFGSCVAKQVGRRLPVEELFRDKIVYEYGAYFLRIRVMNSAGLRKQHNVKASTLESWLVTFVRLISNLTTDARGERNGAALLCKGLFEKLDNESKSLIREYNLSRHIESHKYVDRYEVTAMIEHALDSSREHGRNVKVQTCVALLLCFFCSWRPSTMAPHTDENADLGYYMRFKDFKFIRTGLGSYAVQIVAQHHKGGNGKKGLSQTVQLQPLRYAHNLPLDITVWLIVYFWSRGAFVIKDFRELIKFTGAELLIDEKVMNEAVFVACSPGGRHLLPNKPSRAKSLSASCNNVAVHTGLPTGFLSHVRRAAANKAEMKGGKNFKALLQNHHEVLTTGDVHYSRGVANQNITAYRVDEMVGPYDNESQKSAAYVHLLNSDAIKRLVFKAARESREEDRNGPEEGEATALELEDLENRPEMVTIAEEIEKQWDALVKLAVIPEGATLPKRDKQGIGKFRKTFKAKGDPASMKIDTDALGKAYDRLNNVRKRLRKNFRAHKTAGAIANREKLMPGVDTTDARKAAVQRAQEVPEADLEEYRRGLISLNFSPAETASVMMPLSTASAPTLGPLPSAASLLPVSNAGGVPPTVSTATATAQALAAGEEDEPSSGESTIDAVDETEENLFEDRRLVQQLRINLDLTEAHKMAFEPAAMEAGTKSTAAFLDTIHYDSAYALPIPEVPTTQEVRGPMVLFDEAEETDILGMPVGLLRAGQIAYLCESIEAQRTREKGLEECTKSDGGNFVCPTCRTLPPQCEGYHQTFTAKSHVRRHQKTHTAWSLLPIQMKSADDPARLQCPSHKDGCRYWSTNLTDVYDHCITEKSCPGQPAYVKMHQKDGTGDKKRKSRGKGKPQAKGKQSSKGKGKGKHRAVSDGESSEALDSDSDSDSDDGSDTGTDNHGPKKRPRIDDRPVTATPLSSTVTFGKTIADLDNKSMVSKVMRSFNARDIVNDRNFAKSYSSLMSANDIEHTLASLFSIFDGSQDIPMPTPAEVKDGAWKGVHEIWAKVTDEV